MTEKKTEFISIINNDGEQLPDDVCVYVRTRHVKKIYHVGNRTCDDESHVVLSTKITLSTLKANESETCYFNSKYSL